MVGATTVVVTPAWWPQPSWLWSRRGGRSHGFHSSDVVVATSVVLAPASWLRPAPRIRNCCPHASSLWCHCDTTCDSRGCYDMMGRPEGGSLIMVAPKYRGPKGGLLIVVGLQVRWLTFVANQLKGDWGLAARVLKRDQTSVVGSHLFGLHRRSWFSSTGLV